MKSHIVCTLVLFQIVSIYGASGGYREYRSPLNTQSNKSASMDWSFEPSVYVLDWADLSDGKNEEVRAVALVSMQQESVPSSDSVKKAVQALAPRLLRNLKQLNKENKQAYERVDLSAKEDLSLPDVKALIFRLTCAGLFGAVHVCYDPSNESYVDYQTSSRWQASLHIKNGRPFCMGSPDETAAAKGVESLLQDEECDLHSLIFHRNPALILQDQ